MTLSQIIKLRTNNGRTIVDFLVDVMQDRYDDFRMCHRLQAARLLNTYGNEDAPDFIDVNTTDSSSRTRKRKPSRPTRFDTELARVIREDSDDGRSIARFLVNVMVGEFKSFRPHHRMAAARELLDRGFGKSTRNEKVVHPDSTKEPNPLANETNEIMLISESQKSEFRQSTDEQTLTPQNNTPRIDIPDDTGYWLGIYDSPLYDFMGACEHPDFDPFLAAVDEDYSQSFTDCTDPECEVHGDPPNFDPNDHHY